MILETTMPISPLRILLVEDSEHDLIAFRRAFRKARIPCDLIVCPRAEEALERLDTSMITDETLDLVVTDYKLPGMTGMEFYKELRTRGISLPVVLVTGAGTEHVAVQALRAGLSDYIIKDNGKEYLELLPMILPDVARRYEDRIARQRAEEALQRQRDWFNVLLSSIGDAVIATDIAGRITFMNRVAERLTGYQSSEVLGEPVSTVFRLLNEQTLQPSHDPILPVLGDQIIRQIAPHTALVRRNGTNIPIADSVAPILDEAGSLYGAVVVFRDVTAYRHLESRLQQAQKMEAIGTLAGGIAHDFNNLLGAILGFADLAQYDIPSESSAARYLREVLTAGQRAKNLVQQILTFSRHNRPQRQLLKLHIVAQEALRLLPLASYPNITLRPHVDNDVGAISGDQTQLHQVIMNLCMNALDAMSNTGGELEVALDAIEIDATVDHLHLPLGPYVRLSVRDTGSGIPPAIREHIFEPFFTTKKSGEGSGLGLAIVHGILSNHHGTINVDSIAGEGTTFTVYLPRVEAALTPDPAHTTTISSGTERILFVDDQEALGLLAQNILSRCGYRVSVYTSGAEALEDFRAAPEQFDLVITDQTMGFMNGDVLAREIWQIRPDIPIILCTGYSSEINANNAADLGFAALLMKPWGIQEITAIIRQVLSS